MAYFSGISDDEKSSEDYISGSISDSEELKIVISETDDEDFDLCTKSIAQEPKTSFHNLQRTNLNDLYSSDSDDQVVVNKVKLRKQNFNAKNQYKNQVVLSDSEEETSDPKKNSVKSESNKNNVVSSSSDDETVNTGDFPTPKNYAEYKTLDSKETSVKTNSRRNNAITSDSDNENKNVCSVPIPSADVFAQLEKDRLSRDFKQRILMSSTFVDSESTPKNNETGKRMLNKSIETPRLFKQIKEDSSSTENQNAYGTPVNISKSFKNPNATPHRSVTQILSDSDEPDIIDISEEEIIEVSDGSMPSNHIKNIKQPTLPELLMKKPIVEERNISGIIEVSAEQYQKQQEKIQKLHSELQTTATLINTINLEHLPDKGISLKNRQDELDMKHLEEVQTLSKMKLSQNQPRVFSWKEIEAGATKVQPNTFGKKAMSTYNAQKALTVDRLQQLHGSLATCPKDNDLAEPPKGLKVDLMTHQLRALSWLMWREKQKPSGGILADDMGLGKTLTMLSLMLKCNEVEKGTSSDEEEHEEDVPSKKGKYKGGTLVVCPASLINQWSGELERRTKRGLASCELYHGSKRETKPKRLAQYDLVITTYSIVNNEKEKNGAVFQVKWRRIILDEAHQIRNHKSQTSEAVCTLTGTSRWALTGTPIHNKELDMFALLKFLRCSPFDDLAVWKRWVGDKNTGGTERLHTVISSLMLRRTKAELIEKGLLNTMPNRNYRLISVDLTKNERSVYSKVLIFSRTLFAQFLHQRAEKFDDFNAYKHENTAPPNEEYFSMRQKLLRLNKLRDIKQHEILVLLLRLRQICNHPYLIKSMLHEDMELLGDGESTTDRSEALDLLDQLNNLDINDQVEEPVEDSNMGESEGSALKDVVKNVLSASDPVFCETRMSSKIKAVIDILKNDVLSNNDKAIIVSQWPSFLNLIAHHLKEGGIKFEILDGSVPVSKRMDIVDRINNPKDKIGILLLSLTAGGVGLNLVGANHLILLDLHWNPQLENQAQDRIYRVGQLKPVFVYKLMATDTIEKRILDLQEKKLNIAESMLTGTVQATRNKLSLQDLKMLFEM